MARTPSHMWVEFVVGSPPRSERFFSGYSGFSLSSKTTISKFQFDRDYSEALYPEPLVRLLVRTLKIEPRNSTQAFTRRVNSKVFTAVTTTRAIHVLIAKHIVIYIAVVPV